MLRAATSTIKIVFAEVSKIIVFSFMKHASNAENYLFSVGKFKYDYFFFTMKNFPVYPSFTCTM